jgi:hypothetical protein
VLGLSISLATLGGMPTNSIVSSGKGARATIDLLVNRAGTSAKVEGYDCLVAAVSEVGLDTLYQFADAVIENITDRITTDYVFEAQDCLKNHIVELSR